MITITRTFRKNDPYLPGNLDPDFGSASFWENIRRPAVARSVPCSCANRIGRFLVTGLLLFSGVMLFPQSYQSGFEEKKYDQAKTPKTIHGGFSIDIASGAVGLNYPLGPGIGGKDIRWQPKLEGSWEPKWVQTWQHNVGSFTDDKISSGVSLSHPGTTNGTKFALPNGENVSATVPLSVQNNQVQIPSGQSINIFELLNNFKFTQINRNSPIYTLWSNLPSITSNGNIVIPCDGPDGPVSIGDASFGIGHPYLGFRECPRYQIVISGDFAYEYKYSYHRYIKTQLEQQVDGYPAGTDFYTCGDITWELNSIRNRFGDVISFTYGYANPNGLTYIDVKWKPGGIDSGVGMKIECLYSSQNPSSKYQLDLKYYSPSGEDSAYQINTGFDQTATGSQSYLAFGTNPMTGKLTAWGHLMPDRIKDSNSGFEINFSYAPIGIYSLLSINEIREPGKTSKLIWGTYPFLPYRSEGGGALGGSDGSAYFQYYAPPMTENFGYTGNSYGVTRLDEIDNATSQTRSTLYERVLPILNDYEFVTTPYPFTAMTACFWHSTTFKSTVTRPDGVREVHEFVPPVNGKTG
ncbi:MAG: hypothetical protein Q8O19_07180, partial [Rectinemataceae bacterium]|nr:hypothetical protein [Rectinemataceae bacterium]